MTEWGGKIADITLEELKEKLAETEDDGKAVKRLMTAIAYKQGQYPADIEESSGISRKNVYVWLDRIGTRGLDDALYDEPKPGRPSKLSKGGFAELEAVLQTSPDEAGHEDVRS